MRFQGEFWRHAKKYIPTFKPQSESRRIAVECAFIYGTIYVVTNYIVGLTICVGESMIPTLDPDGEVALINRFSYRILGTDYQIGDVVISKSVYDPTKTVCKRVRGVAGDTMAFYSERYPHGNVSRVPEGHVWLVGDNAHNSHDSRHYGAVPLGLLQGRVFVKVGMRPKIHAVKIDTIVGDYENRRSKPRRFIRNECYNLSRDHASAYEGVTKLRESAAGLITNSDTKNESVAVPAGTRREYVNNKVQRDKQNSTVKEREIESERCE